MSNNNNVMAATQPSQTQSWLAVIATALAIFSVVTTEMLPVGLLTTIAATFEASMGTAGLMMTLPALLAALFAPCVVIASGGVDRKRMLSGLLVLLVAANLASAAAPTIGWLLAARAIVGFCIGGIWAIAGGLAIRLVPARSVGIATSIIFSGVAAASVLGVPIGAFIGDLVGWRTAFGAMAAFSGVVLLLLVYSLPALPANTTVNVRQFGTLLTQARVQQGIAITLFLVVAHFMAFTFVRPFMLTVSGVDVEAMGLLFFAYGIAGIIGNFVAGIAAVKHIGRTLMVITLGIAVTLVTFVAIGDSPVRGAVMLVLWGLAYGGVSVALMTCMMKAAPQAIEVGAALLVMTFNAGIGLGAFFGGHVVDGLGVNTNMLLASGLALLAFVVAVSIHRNIRAAAQSV